MRLRSPDPAFSGSSGCLPWGHMPTTCALSLQFCTELNQPILPNIRKWKGPRGCWKVVVSETPSTQLPKVTLSWGMWIFLSPSRRRLMYSFASILDVMLYCCPFFRSVPFMSKCPGSHFLFRSDTGCRPGGKGSLGVGREGEILSGAKAAHGAFLSFGRILLSPRFPPQPFAESPLFVD